MTERKALKLALEALECTEYPQDHYDAITAIKEALAQPEQRNLTEQEHDVLMKSIKASSTVVSKGFLAQPEQEPVAWITEWEGQYSSGKILDYMAHTRGGKVEYTPLYTTPPQRKPLTEDEVVKMDEWLFDQPFWRVLMLVRAIEAAHGIKE